MSTDPRVRASATVRLRRRLVFVAALLPIMLGALHWLGRGAGWYGTEVELASVITASTLGGWALLAWVGRSSEREDRHRTDVEAKLEQERELLSAVVEGTTDAVFVKDIAGRYLMINSAGAGFLGREVCDIVGRTDEELLPAETAAEFKSSDLRVLESGVSETSEEVGVTEGVRRVYLASKGPRRGRDGAIEGIIGISRDITALKEAEARRFELEREIRRQAEEQQSLLQHLAYHDSLTGLGNRRSFEQSLQTALEPAERERSPLALLLLDVDNLKTINDTWGHDVGDQALKHVSAVLRGRLRDLDDQVFRIGGDEFGVVLRGTSLAEARTVARSLEGSLQRAPLTAQGETITVRMSSGVAGLDLAGRDDTERNGRLLLIAADRDLYAAKALARTRAA